MIYYCCKDITPLKVEVSKFLFEEIKDEKMSYTEKLLKVLSDMNSSETFEYIGSELKNQNDMNNSKEGSELDMSTKSKMEISVPSINKEQSLSMQGSTLDESAKSTNVSSDMEIKHHFWIKNQYQLSGMSPTYNQDKCHTLQSDRLYFPSLEPQNLQKPTNHTSFLF